ncbi:zinc-finger of the MIZ type in Nse subunit-domain-containing protein [Annulohypoxylon maeteangense]|uniref:zinc-finger of the MIZ type in Nse subunit-domain-containing protein n=1 Tax=Annulohypoxylon maeteangense TaxID=1927788 RepID=UPI002007D5F0|nr:zinc-finger of the MIZ type in Nse subunit-domain-containing protein [Annulohypoxylon maeteangense]KAI0888259.1 zinc-finger of the MIZ type in Nse subunit-domain-containing protein [Annulohypoxylon maeteangense]
MSNIPGKRRLQAGRPRHSSVSSHAPTALPDYEPLSRPLDASAIRELTQLSAGKDTRAYEAHLKKSIELLSATVRDINDRYAERQSSLKRLQEKRAENGGEKNDRERAEEKAVLALKASVPALTAECDNAVRSVIDSRVVLEDSNTALSATAVFFEEDMRRRGARGAEDEDVEMEETWPEPTAVLRQARERAAEEYAAKSLHEKYGLSNDYIGFKRLWHDAVHGGDGKPLPDATKWFGQNGGEDEEDDDEDLVIEGEQLDIHCPLSMVVMQDPYTSSVCKHTFEKDSITQFLLSRPGRRARCPQVGCNKEVSIKDFHPDPVRLRLIQRRLASEREDEDDDGEGEGDTIDGDSSMRITQGRKIKKEREDRGRGRRQVEDIEDDDDDDEDEDEDEEL